ncbi:MAG TPA: YtxH domain-containing protein [Longimicrobiales bacterium]
MSDRDDAQYVLIERKSGGSFGAFVWGAALGAGIALLMAPRSGLQTRNELRAGVQRLRDRAEGAVRSAQDSVSDRFDGVRSDVRVRMDAAREAFEAGRRVARGGHDHERGPRSASSAQAPVAGTDEDTEV